MSDESTWRPTSNGSGPRHWGAARYHGREWLQGTNGRYRRFATPEAAQLVADRENARG